MQPLTHLEEVLLEDVLTEHGTSRDLVLYNDDVNTFDHVIECLCSICGHDPIQAEQCAWIVHYKGRCSVKRGAFAKLEPLCNALHQQGLSADIN